MRVRVLRALCAGSAGRGVSGPETDRFTACYLLATALCVLAWGYFLHQGVAIRWAVLTPCGRCLVLPTRCGRDGADALCCGAVQNETSTFAWVALVPTAWLLICTLTAGCRKRLARMRKSDSWRLLTSSGNDRQRQYSIAVY